MVGYMVWVTSVGVVDLQRCILDNFSRIFYLYLLVPQCCAELVFQGSTIGWNGHRMTSGHRVSPGVKNVNISW